MVSFLYQAPAGFPGDVSRPTESLVDSAFLVSPFPANYGLPMQYVTGPDGTGVTSIITAGGASGFVGILTRSYPAISQNSSNDSIGTFDPNQQEVQGLCARGFVLVTCAFGTPVRGQPVYVCTTAEAGHTVGALEAGSNAYNTILSGVSSISCTWASDGTDDSLIAEVHVSQ